MVAQLEIKISPGRRCESQRALLEAGSIALRLDAMPSMPCAQIVRENNHL